ncbi:hypothetical protein, partial [Limnohabitans sp. Rim8]|uniref:hypothetical protein n=1 Tax=Limnohabitans sp. Rim8 TaxID=1100718 RepID=UPI0026281890
RQRPYFASARLASRRKRGIKSIVLGRRANQETSVNFHAKAVLAFIAFHATVTGEGLLFEGTPATTS